MKHLLIWFVSFLLMGNSIHSQENAFSIGPRAGVNFSNVNNVDDSKGLIGLVAGITATYSVNEGSGITGELLYSREGYERMGEEIKLAYLDIPLYYNLFFAELGEAFRPKVYVGVVPGFLLTAENDDTDIKDNLSAFHFAVSGGLGFNYRIANRVWLNVDARGDLGLTDIRDEDFQDDDQVSNQVIQVSVGVAYGL